MGRLIQSLGYVVAKKECTVFTLSFIAREIGLAELIFFFLVVTDLELNAMCNSIEREDILMVYGMIGLSLGEVF